MEYFLCKKDMFINYLTQNDTRVPNEKAIPLLFNDVDDETAQYWFKRFEPQRNDFTAPTVPNAPWNLTMPKTYIITTDDQTATLQFQFMMLQGVADNTWSIKSLASGHESFISHTENLAEVLLQKTY